MTFEERQKKLLKSGKLFTDKKFPPNDTSIWRNGKRSSSFLPNPPQMEWKRPKEFVTHGLSFTSKSHGDTKDISRFDIDQGTLGDCWFLTAVLGLARMNKKAFERVVPPGQGFEEDQYTGMFKFNFYDKDHWTQVVIDDFLLVKTEARQLMFCRNNEDPGEMWAPLLEKAFAKFKGGYYALKGGWGQNAMVNLTGGTPDRIDFLDKDDIDPDLYTKLDKALENGTLMCACQMDEESKVEYISSGNLLNWHEYAITKFEEVKMGEGGYIRLIRLMNPHGFTEWRGRWSDGSKEMEALPDEVKAEMQYRNKEDGEFWMSFDEFLQLFDSIGLCYPEPIDLDGNELPPGGRHKKCCACWCC